jgi:hypothetical protein
MSDWSNWSNVDATGASYRYRYVLRPALNGGKKCDDLLLHLKKGELFIRKYFLNILYLSFCFI